MIQEHITIINKLGLHARALSKLVTPLLQIQQFN